MVTLITVEVKDELSSDEAKRLVKLIEGASSRIDDLVYDLLVDEADKANIDIKDVWVESVTVKTG